MTSALAGDERTVSQGDRRPASQSAARERERERDMKGDKSSGGSESAGEGCRTREAGAVKGKNGRTAAKSGGRRLNLRQKRRRVSISSSSFQLAFAVHTLATGTRIKTTLPACRSEAGFASGQHDEGIHVRETIRLFS